MGASADVRTTGGLPPTRGFDVLDGIQRRILWLAVSIVQHANSAAASGSGVKVGGHQASSASIVIDHDGALLRSTCRPRDRVSVKPHASPVLHAIKYLLGRLDRDYLTQLRAFGGLPVLPEPVKDPDPADFSTGSVGIGATAPIWSALAHRYVAGTSTSRAAAADLARRRRRARRRRGAGRRSSTRSSRELGEVLWIVDVNRQSLDRVVPDMAAAG